MSSGACRALVAVLLTLVATIVMTVPVAAQDTQPVNTRGSTTYRVNPGKGTIDVIVNVVLKPTQRWEAGSVWEQLIIEETTKERPKASSGFRVLTGRSRDVPGLYRAYGVRTPALPVGENSRVTVRYTIEAPVALNERVKSQTPARLDNSYMYFCVTGQDTQTGNIRVELDDTDKWKPTQLGTPMEATDSGFEFRATGSRPLGDVFTCFEGVRTDFLDKETIIAPDGRRVELQAWRSGEGWLPAALLIVPGELQALHDFLGYDIPGEGTLVIRQAPSSEIGGYASAHGTPGIVQLDEGPDGDTMHQLAHAWFGTDNFIHFWLREGMAEWISSTIAGDTCAPASELDPAAYGVEELDLELPDKEWLVVRPQASENVEALIEAQEAAACGIVAEIAARMPDARWNEVIGSMLLGETKYVGSAGPEIGTATVVDWREWLDAVDERGLVPAASAPEYAGNLEDLDFAQDLLDRFGIPDVDGELEERSAARAAYHEFLAYVAPLGAPSAVRKHMDDWEFDSALSRMEKSREVFDRLTEADDQLPEADLLRIVKPEFEAAKDDAELEEVVALIRQLVQDEQTVPVIPLRQVVVAVQPIEQGTSIEPEMVTLRTVPLDATNEMALTDTASALGKVVAIDILANQAISPNMLVPE